MKMKFYLIVIAIISLSLIPQLNGYLVNVRVETLNGSNFQSEVFCARKKIGTSGNDDVNNILFNLFLYQRDPCIAQNDYLNANNSKVVFVELDLKTKIPQCGFNDIVKNASTNVTRYMLFGTDGIINASINHTFPLVFMPLEYSNRLLELSNQFTTALAININKAGLFDYNLIFLLLLPVITVFFGARLNKRSFIISLYRKTRMVYIKKKRAEKKMLDKEATLPSSTGNDINLSSHKPSSLYANSTDPIIKQKSNSTLAPVPEEEPNNQRNLKSYLCIFEEDDGEYDDDRIYDDLPQVNQISKRKISLAIVLEITVFISTILLLYYLYDVMIYFVYVIFVLSGSISMTNLILLGVNKIDHFTIRLKRNKIPYFRSRPRLRDMLIFLVCLAFSILWFVFRKESFGWIFQDIIALSISLNVLSRLRLLAFKWVFLILVAFLIYDVIMVFITPFITNGRSVMEAIVNGGQDWTGYQVNWGKFQFGDYTDDTNRLPLLISIPNLGVYRKSCELLGGSMHTSLGLGDILIPGICINLSIIYDLASSNRYSVYFSFNIAAYAVGLFLAFIGFVFMEQAQPALFYICPCLLFVNIILPLCRREFKEFYSGDTVKKYIDVNTGYTKDLSMYKVKKERGFNVLKFNRDKTKNKDDLANTTSTDTNATNQGTNPTLSTHLSTAATDITNKTLSTDV